MELDPHLGEAIPGGSDELPASCALGSVDPLSCLSPGEVDGCSRAVEFLCPRSISVAAMSALASPWSLYRGQPMAGVGRCWKKALPVRWCFVGFGLHGLPSSSSPAFALARRIAAGLRWRQSVLEQRRSRAPDL